MGRTVERTDLEIDFDTIKNVIDFIPIYHGKEDTFFLRPEESKSAVSFDWNGDIWLRINPGNGEIVGFQIDDFESVFLKKYPELANAWKEVKPLCHRKKKTQTEETFWEAFLKIILEFLQTMVREKPQQAEFAV